MTVAYRTINTRYINTITVTHTDNKNHETCHTDLNTYPNMDDAMDQWSMQNEITIRYMDDLSILEIRTPFKKISRLLNYDVNHS